VEMKYGSSVLSKGWRDFCGLTCVLFVLPTQQPLTAFANMQLGKRILLPNPPRGIPPRGDVRPAVDRSVRYVSA